MIIKITKEDKLCECGHYQSEHGSYGTCYKSTRRTERKRNPKNTGKYENVICCYSCSCKEFKENERNNN